MDQYKAPIRGITKLILSSLAMLASLFTSRIKDEEVRLMAVGVIDGAQNTIEVLSDADPNDRQQMLKVLNDILKGPFSVGAKAELMQQIEKLDDENLRKLLLITSNQVFPIATLLSDENPDDKGQIRAQLKQFLTTPDGMEFFTTLLGIVLPPTFALTLATLIIQAIISTLEDAGESVAALRAVRDQMEQRLFSLAA